MRNSPRIALLGLLLTAGQAPALAQRPTVAVKEAGGGQQTYVLLSGMVGGVAGFGRLEQRLLQQGHRVIVIDPYQLSLDSADVSFAAMARRVDALLVQRGVRSARMVGHAHGAGVMLRVAAMAPERVSELYFLDVGALAVNRTKVLSASLRLVPVVARIPGGRAFIRERLVRGLRENCGSRDWLDAGTQRAYTEPMLDEIDQVIRLVVRLGAAEEPESLDAVLARVQAPAVVILGGAPHESGPDAAELSALGLLRPRIERLSGVGHFPHEEAPDAVARIIGNPIAIVARRPAATT